MSNGQPVINDDYNVDTISDLFDIRDSRHERRDNPRDDKNPDNTKTVGEHNADRHGAMIYRFKFTESFMKKMFVFSKVHQYDDRDTFKEAWTAWTEDNMDAINEEVRRLENMGYDGDILTKMFKSARYYFRKKSTEKKMPKQRRQYVSINKELLDAMDSHIQQNIFNVDYQPKTGFILFCKENETLIKECISKIFEGGIRDSESISEKVKKTYKNRYFRFVTNTDDAQDITLKDAK